METISSLCGWLVAVAIFVTPVLFLIFLVRWLMRRSKKKIGIATLISAASIVIFTIIGVSTAPSTHCEHDYKIVESEPATCTKSGLATYHCDLCGSDSEEVLDELGHDMMDVRKVNPTYDASGEYVEGCTRCDYEEITILEKLQLPAETTAPPTTVQHTEPPVTIYRPDPVEPTTATKKPEKSESTRSADKFAEIYEAFESNELVASEKYEGKRYRIEGTIVGIETGGLFNLTGGATLTMKNQVGNTIVFFLAEFEKDQEEALKRVAVGDTIRFEGECLTDEMWIECEIVK